MQFVFAYILLGFLACRSAGSNFAGKRAGARARAPSENVVYPGLIPLDITRGRTGSSGEKILSTLLLSAAPNFRAPRIRMSEVGQDEPFPREPVSKDAMPEDWKAHAQDMQEIIDIMDKKPASPEELAKHVGFSWVADMMLDPALNEEYRRDAARAPANRVQNVSGRSFDNDEMGIEFWTLEELAEDHDFPVESLWAEMLACGVSRKDLRIDAPLKTMTQSSAQLNKFMRFLNSADRIACIEELSDLTLAELAESASFEVTAEDLCRICRSLNIDAMLGANTRIKATEVSLLLQEAMRKAGEMDIR